MLLDVLPEVHRVLGPFVDLSTAGLAELLRLMTSLLFGSKRWQFSSSCWLLGFSSPSIPVRMLYLSWRSCLAIAARTLLMASSVVFSQSVSLQVQSSFAELRSSPGPLTSVA